MLIARVTGYYSGKQMPLPDDDDNKLPAIICILFIAAVSLVLWVVVATIVREVSHL